MKAQFIVRIETKNENENLDLETIRRQITLSLVRYFEKQPIHFNEISTESINE